MINILTTNHNEINSTHVGNKVINVHKTKANLKKKKRKGNLSKTTSFQFLLEAKPQRSSTFCMAVPYIIL